MLMNFDKKKQSCPFSKQEPQLDLMTRRDVHHCSFPVIQKKCSLQYTLKTTYAGGHSQQQRDGQLPHQVGWSKGWAMMIVFLNNKQAVKIQDWRSRRLLECLLHVSCIVYHMHVLRVTCMNRTCSKSERTHPLCLQKEETT